MMRVRAASTSVMALFRVVLALLFQTAMMFEEFFPVEIGKGAAR